MIEAIAPGVVEDLARPDAYPHDPDAQYGIEAVQTHLSHVWLTRQRVYKLRKAVELPFVHFGTRAARNQDCLREIALNRRLAPDVYLGVAAIEATADGWRIGALAETLASPGEDGAVPEHCVIMRRLPEGRDALSLLEAGRLTAHHVDAVAVRLADFHDRVGLGVPAPWEPEVWRQRVEAPVANNFRVMTALDWPAEGRALIAELEVRTRRCLESGAQRFEARRAAGRAVDGHGDVHLQHVWFEGETQAGRRPARSEPASPKGARAEQDGGGPPQEEGTIEPLLIDCLEFEEDLRHIDCAADVAFLAMDLEYRGRADLAERLLRVYARERDDFDLYGVIDYFESYRAAVRAKVAGLAAADPQISGAQREAAAASALRHLRLAADTLERPGPGALALLCGVVGSGKSTLAEVLADETHGVVISSDLTRKRMAGLAPTQRGDGGRFEGIYTSERSDAVYAGLLARAAPVVESGRVAVLDASFSRRDLRTRARRWAEERGLPILLLEARCAPEVALERLDRREARGTSPSDAGPSFYAVSVDTFEDTDEWPAATRRAVKTDASDWREAVREAAERLRPEIGNGGS